MEENNLNQQLVDNLNDLNLGNNNAEIDLFIDDEDFIPDDNFDGSNTTFWSSETTFITNPSSIEDASKLSLVQIYNILTGKKTKTTTEVDSLKKIVSDFLNSGKNPMDKNYFDIIQTDKNECDRFILKLHECITSFNHFSPCDSNKFKKYFENLLEYGITFRKYLYSKYQKIYDTIYKNTDGKSKKYKEVKTYLTIINNYYFTSSTIFNSVHKSYLRDLLKISCASNKSLKNSDTIILYNYFLKHVVRTTYRDECVEYLVYKFEYFYKNGCDFYMKLIIENIKKYAKIIESKMNFAADTKEKFITRLSASLYLIEIVIRYESLRKKYGRDGNELQKNTKFINTFVNRKNLFLEDFYIVFLIRTLIHNHYDDKNKYELKKMKTLLYILLQRSYSPGKYAQFCQIKYLMSKVLKDYSNANKYWEKLLKDFETPKCLSDDFYSRKRR